MASTWVKSTAYALGTVVVNTTMGTKWYVCTKAGQSGSTTPFDNTTDDTGDVITDYQVRWVCRGSGGVGCLKLTYSTNSVILPGEDLDVKWTYGNPNMSLTRRGKSTGPRSRVYYNGEEVLQIAGVLNGPLTPTEIARLRTIFKTRFKDNSITLTMTGDNATKYGASLTVMHSGANSIRVTPLRGHRYMHKVDIQVIVVDNS